MTAPTTIGVDRVRVAAGSGVLARTAAALLFVPDVDTSTADRLVAAFMSPDDAVDRDDDAVIEAVSGVATEQSSGVVGFVLVTWAEHLRIVALGTVEVRTDHPGLPMLSGTGSASWVERRIRLDASTVTVVVGADASPWTDLRLGCVEAGGFAASFAAKSSIVSSLTQPSVESPTVSVVAPTEPPAPSAPGIDTIVPPDIDHQPPPVDPTEPVRGDRLAALRAAVRQHDQAGGVDVARSADTSVIDGADAGSTPPPPADEEITLAPGDPEPGQQSPGPDREIETVGDGNPQAVDDNDTERAPFVSAARCPRGHANPTHVAVCRQCGDLLDDTVAAESIRQPPLAVLDLGTGRTMPIDRSLVLGRQPELDAAQAPERARAVVVSDDTSVSRTHLRIDVEDWTLTVTDCGSRSGTAIVTRPGEEPRVLEPWMPHELPIGARLFLGGPTSVVIRDVASEHRSNTASSHA
jgi:FHA domain